MKKITAPTGRLLLACALIPLLSLLPTLARAGEGGTSHALPGANVSLIDMAPTKPGAFVKPMYLHYHGTASTPIPTAAGIAGDMEATVDTFVLGGGYTFEQPVLGDAHFTLAAFQPYSWMDVSANLSSARASVRRDNKVSGLGDLAVVPMLAWKNGFWQFDTLLPIYAPTGSYEKGRLGNPGLNYWSFDPTIGIAYSNPDSGFNALLHAGYLVNTENEDTSYRSGSVLHLDAALQQIIPLGGGFMTVGVEGFYFDQLTSDKGDGATLGSFKGRSSGLGPVLGYIKPLGQQSLALELKWLTETETRNRLKGDYVWLKMAYKF